MPSLAHTQHLIQTCHLVGGKHPTGYAADFFMAPRSLEPAVRAVAVAGFFLENITAMDMEEGYQLVYHFDHAHRPGRVCLRVMIPHETAEAPSVCHIFHGADWHERECYDFFGIHFTGHPNLLPLLLAPERSGEPPLRKTPGTRTSLYHIFPGRTFEVVSPDDDVFKAAILAPATATAGESV